MRSTAVHGIREKSAAIFDLFGNLIASNIDKSKNKTFQDLITVNGEYCQFPPLLFPDTSMNMPDVFRNENLPKVSIHLLFT